MSRVMGSSRRPRGCPLHLLLAMVAAASVSSAVVAAEGNREMQRHDRASDGPVDAVHASQVQALAQVDGFAQLCAQAFPGRQAELRSIMEQALPDVSRRKAVRLRQEPSYQSALQAIRAQGSGNDAEALKQNCSVWLSLLPATE